MLVLYSWLKNSEQGNYKLLWKDCNFGDPNIIHTRTFCIIMVPSTSHYPTIYIYTNWLIICFVYIR